jgi:hypothetical protein
MLKEIDYLHQEKLEACGTVGPRSHRLELRQPLG